MHCVSFLPDLLFEHPPPLTLYFNWKKWGEGLCFMLILGCLGYVTFGLGLPWRVRARNRKLSPLFLKKNLFFILKSSLHMWPDNSSCYCIINPTISEYINIFSFCPGDFTNQPIYIYFYRNMEELMIALKIMSVSISFVYIETISWEQYCGNNDSIEDHVSKYQFCLYFQISWEQY